jgi:peptidoglycan/LPS O-acetylase OafA/YrhL
MHFLPRIESLRGIAALTVVAFHVRVEFSSVPIAGLDAAAFYLFRCLSNGVGAVVGFFVISGFVLARSLAANPEPARYFRNRIFRLFPAAVFVVALLTALYQCFGVHLGQINFSPGNVLLNMLMIRTDINGPMWSLKVECFATPLILFSAWLVRREGVPWLWAAIFVLFGLSFWGTYIHALGYPSSLASLYAFIVGVLALHYGRLLTIRPSVATLAVILSVSMYCYCGTFDKPALILLLECVCASVLVIVTAYFPLSILRPLDLSVCPRRS